MNLPKFPHSAMFVGVTACGKTEFLLQLLETIYKSHFEFIVILCPTILDNKTYLSRKWIFDDKNVFIVCDIEGKLNEWIKLFKNALKGHQTLFIIDDCSAESEINKKRDALSELAFSGRHRNHSLWVLTQNYCLTKISIRAKRSISRVFSLFIVPSPFFVHCPYKGRINRAESVLTGLKPYQS